MDYAVPLRNCAVVAMTRYEHILEAARSIRPELTQLLGPEEAEKVDCELAELLAGQCWTHRRFR